MNRVIRAISNDKACYSCHAPSERTLGYLEVDVSTTWLRDRIGRSHRLIAGVAGATLLLVWVAITLAMNAAVIAPIRRLQRAMSVVRRGERSVRVEPDAADEIGRLSGTFNKMVDDVAAAEASLVQKEHQLAKAEKLAGIGLMAAGVAHEINNPLAAVLMASEMLAMPGLTESQRDRLRESLAEGAERIRVIVAELLTLDRRQGVAATSERPDEVVREALHLIDVPSNIRVHFRVSDTLPPVLVDRHKIARALGNIIKNAVQAMPDGGELTLEAKASGRWLRLEVSDTGTGMEQEVLEHVFDPFYSTREVGRGFGLGLAVTHGVVLQHGGEIRVRSKVGEGTTFEVVLPLVEENQSNA